MTLREKIDADLKDAMRARDQVRVDTVRNIKSAIKYKEVEGGEAKTIDEPAILKIIQNLIKQRKDSAEQFRTGNRPEMAEKEEREAVLLQVYLPQQLAVEEVEQIVVAAIAEAGATTAKDMGAVMKIAQAKIAGRAEGRVVSDLVKKKLSGG